MNQLVIGLHQNQLDIKLPSDTTILIKTLRTKSNCAFTFSCSLIILANNTPINTMATRTHSVAACTIALLRKTMTSLYRRSTEIHPLSPLMARSTYMPVSSWLFLTIGFVLHRNWHQLEDSSKKFVEACSRSSKFIFLCVCVCDDLLNE